jgi:P-type Cu2+ transporter
MSQRTVLQVQGLHWATSERGIESALMRQPGVEAVAANAANQTATVTYDPQETSVVQLSRWVRDCGYHCAGGSVPNHVCEPMEEPGEHAVAADGSCADHV